MFNKNFIILTLTVIFLIIMFLFMMITSITPAKKENIYPTTFPTTVQIIRSFNTPDDSTEYKKSVEKIAVTEAPIIEKEALVGKLLEKLPYNGTNFRMENNYKTAQMIVVINKDKENEGNNEFEKFLRENGIENRNWIRNLVVKYE